MKQKIGSKGFTLVELLVVISIIAILAGILLPAVIGAFKKASDAQARTEVKSIEVALKQYYTEYGKFPLGNGQADKVYGTGDSDLDGNRLLISILRHDRSYPSYNSAWTTLNPRGITFLEASEDSLKNDAGQKTYDYFDPWGNQYRIVYDANFQNGVETGSGNFGVLYGRNVAVWSLGSASTNYIKSW